jgi:hypothetical protein
VLCPACHEENPDRNRFCGQCGTPLSDRAHLQATLDASRQFRNETFVLQDVIAQPRREPNDDGLPSPDSHESLSEEPLPKEVIDYDNGLPLLAEPGMDRRRQTPDPIRRAMQEVWGNAASINAPIGPAQGDLWNPAADSVSEADVPVPSLDSPTQGEIGFTPLDQPTPEPRNPAEVPAEQPAGVKDLSRFLDFTPAHHGESGVVSGPSFLGLSGDADPPESEEEPKSRKWPRYVAAAVASGFIAAVVVLVVMQWTLVCGAASRVRDAASRYARVGATYVQMLRKGKIASSVKNTEPSSASAGPASDEKAAPDSVVEQHPSQPASEEASAAVPKTTAAPPAPESPANGAGNVRPNSTTLNLEGKSGSGGSAGQTQAVEPKQLATGGPRPATEPVKAAAPKPSDRPSSKPVAGQGEYQQALVTTNPEVARVLLWRATALGNSDAQVRLADMYIYGQGVSQNCEQGLVLLRSAAQMANAQARGKLGALYATGKCVPQDRVQAYRWLTLALNDDQRSEWTEKNREIVWRQMSPKERSRAATAAR